jgi:hypothetical protein
LDKHVSKAEAARNMTVSGGLFYGVSAKRRQKFRIDSVFERLSERSMSERSMSEWLTSEWSASETRPSLRRRDEELPKGAAVQSLLKPKRAIPEKWQFMACRVKSPLLVVWNSKI